MKYNGTNLKEVLEAHKKWLNQTKRIEDDRANLYMADLSGDDLRGVDLRGADLRKADLFEANLNGARFCGADLREACLSYTDLREADLRGTYLNDADLRKTDLSGASLHGAYLSRADLRSTNLYKADLCAADLSGANLLNANLNEADLLETNFLEANLQGADLHKAKNIRVAYLNGAYLRGAKNIPYIPMACPDSGSFIGWKACHTINGKVIVKLLIPEDAKRSSGTGRKCRCDKAIVMEMQNEDGTKGPDIAYSLYNDSFAYKVGEIVVPEKPFEDNRWEECASGIHFFINRQEAVEY